MVVVLNPTGPLGRDNLGTRLSEFGFDLGSRFRINVETIAIVHARKDKGKLTENPKLLTRTTVGGGHGIASGLGRSFKHTYGDCLYLSVIEVGSQNLFEFCGQKA